MGKAKCVKCNLEFIVKKTVFSMGYLEGLSCEKCAADERECQKKDKTIELERKALQIKYDQKMKEKKIELDAAHELSEQSMQFEIKKTEREIFAEKTKTEETEKRIEMEKRAEKEKQAIRTSQEKIRQQQEKTRREEELKVAKEREQFESKTRKYIKEEEDKSELEKKRVEFEQEKSRQQAEFAMLRNKLELELEMAQKKSNIEMKAVQERHRLKLEEDNQRFENESKLKPLTINIENKEGANIAIAGPATALSADFLQALGQMAATTKRTGAVTLAIESASSPTVENLTDSPSVVKKSDESTGEKTSSTVETHVQED